MLKAIIFDFDGVIGDTFDLNWKLCKEMEPNFTMQEFKDNHNGNVFSDKVKYWDAERFFELQKKGFTRDLLLLENTIKKLKDYKIFIISSTNDENIEYFLSLGDYKIDGIYGSTTHKSKVEKFKMIFKEYDLKEVECLFVTDTLGDIKEANEVGVRTIAVTWGFHDEKTLLKGKPYEIAHDANELLNKILNQTSVRAIIIKDRKILLMHRIMNGREYYVLVGGHVDIGESVKEALEREVKEEVNLDVKIDKKLWTLTNPMDGSEHHLFRVTDFCGKVKLGGPEVKRNCESNQYIPEWFDAEEITNLNVVPKELKGKLLEYLS